MRNFLKFVRKNKILLPFAERGHPGSRERERESLAGGLWLYHPGITGITETEEPTEDFVSEDFLIKMVPYRNISSTLVGALSQIPDGLHNIYTWCFTFTFSIQFCISGDCWS